MTRLRLDQLGGSPVRPDGVEDGAVVTVLRVPPECTGMRVDRFVQSQLKRTSRTRAQQIIQNGAYSPEAARLRPGARVQAEQFILLWRAPWDDERVDEALPVLFEDDALLAIDKPPFVVVHPTARYHSSTVVKRLEASRPDLVIRLSHRLDRETSGVLLLAKTAAADKHVKQQFAGLCPTTGKPSARRLVDKTYLAIVHGWPDVDEMRIELPLEEDAASTLRVKMRVSALGTGLVAATGASVKGRRRGPAGARYALVACSLETGRQHQIRVHLAATGHPLVGDKLYGSDERLHARGADGELTPADHTLLELPRHALHAHTLELEHPDAAPGVRVRIESPLPDDLAAFWNALDLP